MQLLIVTGFLGAGKTTLLRHCLATGQLGRAGLLVNEFGSVDIDGALLEQGSSNPPGAAATPLLRLPNGCVCCRVQDDFLEAVQGLCARVDAAELTLERIVLETSGLADPAPLLARVLGSRTLRERFRAVHALTVVDGVAGHSALDQHVEARHQVACADLLLLSKVDRIDAVEAAAWRERLRAANPHAEVIDMVHGAPAAAGWLEQLSTPQCTGRHSASESHGSHAPQPHHHPDGHGPSAHHSPGLESFHLRCAALPSSEHLQEWLSTLLLLHAERLLRLKGFVAVHGVAEPLLLQGALDGMRIASSAGGRAAGAGTELVAIARGMDDARQRESLRGALLAISPQARL